MLGNEYFHHESNFQGIDKNNTTYLMVVWTKATLYGISLAQHNTVVTPVQLTTELSALWYIVDKFLVKHIVFLCFT